MKLPTLLLLLLLNPSLYSQIPGRTTNWFFGNRAGLTFNSGVPVPILTGNLVTTEGVASISSSSGSLLFYTDGRTVWTSQNIPMPNGNPGTGTSLNGHASSTQSAIIVERPGTTNRFFIFTTDADVGTNGICYSEVNMSLNSGYGDVIAASRNTPLRTPSCEKLCAVRHCNNVDIWVISHDWNSNNFRAWLVTSAGVGGAIVSPAGAVVSGIIQSAYGQLKSSPDGHKLLMASYGYQGSGANRIELFDFDKSTGIVSNGQLISTEVGAYGCEFSSNGTIIYAATNGGLLLQWNLCSGTLAQIRSTRFVVSNAGPFIGSLQRGPDSKIYVNRNTTAGLSVINQPNLLGAACFFQSLVVSTGARGSGLGLPNFASFYVDKNLQIPSPQLVSCGTYQFTSPQILSPTCSTPPTRDYFWDFGFGLQSRLENPLVTFPIGTWNVVLRIETGPCDDYNGEILITVTNSVTTGPIYKQ